MTEKIKLAMLKKMATESALQSSLLLEMLAAIKNSDLKDLQTVYRKRYEAAIARQQEWILQTAGLSDSIDWKSLFGYDPLQEDE